MSLADSESSIQIAENFFSWLMDPLSKDDFLRYDLYFITHFVALSRMSLILFFSILYCILFRLYWEKRPVHIGREENRDYFAGLLSTTAIDNMLRQNNILYGKNIDITSYSDGKRETLNSVSLALQFDSSDFSNLCNYFIVLLFLYRLDVHMLLLCGTTIAMVVVFVC